MTDPRRWLDSHEQERSQHRELLEQAPTRRPLDAATRRKMRRRVAHLSATALGASVFMTWLKAIASALGFGAVITVATVATLVARDKLTRRAVASRPNERSGGAATLAAQQPPRPALASVAAPSRAAPERAAPSTPSPQPAPIRTSTARRASATQPANALGETPREEPSTPAPTVATSEPPVEPAVEPVTDSLERERLLLEPARIALARDPRAALRAIELYQHTFSNGQLFAESEYIAIEALRRAGERERAEARAAELSRRFPTSVYATILRRQR